ncbi:MAG: hypothetical protein K6E91_07895 [Butyrivibrio sp.]|nr:hypothetical protein [Butyrivibrio sp.]
MSELLKGNLIVHTSKEDVDAYEKKLKDEKYTSIGSSDDPYLINQFRKKLADFLVDKDGNKNYTGMGGHIDEFYSEEDKKKFEE